MTAPTNNLRTLTELRQQYARLMIRFGVNLQPGQALAIKGEIIHRDFIHQLSREAYAAGARYVTVDWLDPALSRIRLEESTLENLEYVPDYLVTQAEERLATGWAVVNVTGQENPDVYAGVDASRMQRLHQAFNSRTEVWRRGLMGSRIAWSICAAPTVAWAEKIFPDLEPEEGVQRLWKEILAIARADSDDPEGAWAAHLNHLKSAVDALETAAIDTLHFYDPTPGDDGRARTDLRIGLVNDGRWAAGQETTTEGLAFVPNMPTEEIFTAPHRERVDGYVTTTKPFFPFEQQVRDARFTFEAGKVIDFQADKGADVLEQFFATPGTRRLGEVALVDSSSPIFRSGLLFHNTLFDENAASHIAFGRGYPMNVAGGVDMEQEKLEEKGLNNSLLHLDVMIGSATMNVTGESTDGTKTPIMEAGRYVGSLAKSD